MVKENFELTGSFPLRCAGVSLFFPPGAQAKLGMTKYQGLGTVYIGKPTAHVCAGGMAGVSKTTCTCTYNWEAGDEASLLRWNYYSETSKISSARNVPKTSCYYPIDKHSLIYGQASRDFKGSCGPT